MNSNKLERIFILTIADRGLILAIEVKDFGAEKSQTAAARESKRKDLFQATAGTGARHGRRVQGEARL